MASLFHAAWKRCRWRSGARGFPTNVPTTCSKKARRTGVRRETRHALKVAAGGSRWGVPPDLLRPGGVLRFAAGAARLVAHQRTIPCLSPAALQTLRPRSFDFGANHAKA